MEEVIKFFNKFEKIICVNLPESIDRKQYIDGLFHEHGLCEPLFFPAIGKKEKIVSDYYMSGLVKQYPNCFRCGKNKCSNTDCNNILVRAQVATFITYQNIWKYIIDNDIQSALIIEDDVAFDRGIGTKCSQITEEGLIEETGLQGSKPVLIRFGWALCEDHSEKGRVRFIPDLLRMSNPAFSLNKSMALLLHKNSKKVTNTADIYIHDIVGQNTDNYTVVPPLFYERSWSTGEFESLIHPKSIRLDFIKSNKGINSDAYKNALDKISQHVKHIYYFPFLIIGHPRCGSGYMSKILNAYHVDVGHERLGESGISSWMFAVDDLYPYCGDELSSCKHDKYFEYKICYVRNPLTAIPSIVRENLYSKNSYEFRRKHIKLNFDIDLEDFKSNFEKAVASYIYWYKIILVQEIDLIIRVECDERKLKQFLVRNKFTSRLSIFNNLPDKQINKDKLYNGKKYDKEVFNRSDWIDLPPILIAGLNDICEVFGYESPIECLES